MPYRLNFIPSLLLISAVYLVIAILPSSNRGIGYLSWSVISCFVVFLIVKERKRVATEIRVNDVGITAHYSNSLEIPMRWDDIVSLVLSGKGLWLVSSKVEKYLYAEVVSNDDKRIIIRREIEGYSDLISAVESKTGKTFLQS
jgi:hypothetical protein